MMRADGCIGASHREQRGEQPPVQAGSVEAD